MMQPHGSNSSPLPESSKPENSTTAKRAYHTPAAPQEFGQLRTLTLGALTYTGSDGGQFSAIA